MGFICSLSFCIFFPNGNDGMLLMDVEFVYLCGIERRGSQLKQTIKYAGKKEESGGGLEERG